MKHTGMIPFVCVVGALSSVLFGDHVHAYAASSKSRANRSALAATGPRTETSMRFSGSRVDGQSITPFGAGLSGENDKEVFALLDFRKDFKDREQDERSRVGAKR